MTKQDFIQQYRASNRAETRRMGRLAIVLFAVLGLSIVAIVWGLPQLDRLVEKGFFDWTTSIDIYWPIGFLGLMLLVFGCASRFITRPGGVRCPNCSEMLLGTGAGLALMTGRCSHCGEKVVDDPGLTKDFKPYD